jgi:hypothetical protein
VYVPIAERKLDETDGIETNCVKKEGVYYFLFFVGLGKFSGGCALARMEDVAVRQPRSAREFHFVEFFFILLYDIKNHSVPEFSDYPFRFRFV